MNLPKECASSVVSHLCHTAGGFSLKVGPVTESRLVVPVAKRCRQASRGEAVCRFPLRRRFFPGKWKQAGWSLSKRTGNRKHISVPHLMSNSKCRCAYAQLLKQALCHVPSGHSPALNSTLSSVFFHHLAHFSSDVLTFQLAFITFFLSSNFFHLCSFSLFHSHFKSTRLVKLL